MLNKTILLYKASFNGLSKEIWWLTLITFINRAGTMVLPFMSLYLIEDLEFTLTQVGWIMSSFGLGSLLGSWLGGKLTDKFGYYKVMYISLFLTGILFFLLQFVKTFEGFVAAVFLTLMVADTFRPALFVSLKAYSKKENQTRSLTLIRLAINLGFSFGPFLGGLIIAGLGYSGLFWVDGITCIGAVILMMKVLPDAPMREDVADEESSPVGSNGTIAKDFPYITFLIAVFLMGFIFLQLFTTMPLYYKEIYELSEVKIGLIMSMNGFLIFLLEMPLIHTIEQKMLNKMRIVTWSMALFGMSFLILNFGHAISILILSMLLITVGEMMAFPFTNNFAMNRAPIGKEGDYMAWYSMAFSLSHIFSAKVGMELIEKYGYDFNWYVMGGLGFVAMFLIYRLRVMLAEEKAATSVKLDVSSSLEEDMDVDPTMSVRAESRTVE